MGWVKLSDDFAQDVRWDTLGNDAMAMHVSALCQCALSLSNGFFTRARARILLPGLADADALIEALIAAKFWEAEGLCTCLTDEDLDINEVEPVFDQLHITNYLRDQWSKKQVEDRRAAASKRLKEWRATKAAEKAEAAGNGVSNGVASDVAKGDPSKTGTSANGNGVTNGVRNALPSLTQVKSSQLDLAVAVEGDCGEDKNNNTAATAAPGGASSGGTATAPGGLMRPAKRGFDLFSVPPAAGA